MASVRASLLALLVLAACGDTPSAEVEATAPAGPAHRAARSAVRALPPSTYPAPARLIAIGDVHGDLRALRAALRLGGAIDAQDRWAGGELVVVQVGDLLDRGDDEPEILAMIERLEGEAAAAGGRLLALHGNHEVMNGALDFRYVTPEGFTDFDALRAEASGPLRAAVPRPMQGRAAAFAPGGRHARAFASRHAIVIVGGTLFVHGGLSPRWAGEGVDAINRAARAFFLGESPLAPALRAEDGPVWHRGYAGEATPERCAELEAALATAGAERMVIGHTVQASGITSACGGRVWRVDVGLARHYGGALEVLEIVGDEVRALR